MTFSWPEGFRAGFASLVGRPNAGKSTLTNALVGQKVAITSGRPQTTRHTVRGIVHRPDGQLVLVDTPGLHRPRTLLGERLNDLVRETISEVDVVVFCLPADEKVGPGDRYIARELAELRTPVIAVATKSDAVGRGRLAEHLLEIERLGDWAHIVPVSAVRGEQVELLERLLLEQMPESPPLYPEGELTDEPEAVMIAELVREAALEGVRDELPHSLAVVVEEITEREARPGHDAGPAGAGRPGRGGRSGGGGADRPESSDRPRGGDRPGGGDGPGRADRPPMLDVRVNLYVERDSQKAIVIGRGGSRLRDVGTQARRGIEALLGTRVYLDLHVKVAKDWQRDPKLLGRLGF